MFFASKNLSLKYFGRSKIISFKKFRSNGQNSLFQKMMAPKIWPKKFGQNKISNS